MKKRLMAVLVTALLAMTALVTIAPMASADVGTATKLKPQHYGKAWVHFRPTLNSAYLEVSDARLSTVCYVDVFNDRRWNLVVDNSLERAGYTWAEYLTSPSQQWCGNVGRATGGAKADTWVHLFPAADWAYEVIHPGTDVAAICKFGFGTPEWGLFVDHSTNVAGYTWRNSFHTQPDVPVC